MPITPRRSRLVRTATAAINRLGDGEYEAPK